MYVNHTPILGDNCVVHVDYTPAILHKTTSSRASGATVSARAENHRKVLKTMPEGVQKRHRTIKKHSRNVSEITWQNHASKNRKLSPSRQHPRGTQKSSKNEPRNPPEPPWPHNLAQGAPELTFYAQTSHFIDFGYPFASFLQGTSDPKSS